MEADWYVDPLERFDGRFFDGERWTDRVSDGGELRRDPDFPTTAGSANRTDGAFFGPVSKRPESPTRVVAVLDSLATSAAVSDGDADPAETAPRSHTGRWFVAAVVLLAVIVAALTFWLSGDDQDSTVARSVELGAVDEERVEDLQDGSGADELDPDLGESLEVDAPRGVVDADEVFESDESVELGPLTVLNGASVLAELSDWHAEYSADRGSALEDSAGCWFGELGGAAVQVAHCGPISGGEGQEYRFDLVPLRFEDRPGGQVAQPVVDDVTPSAVLSNAVVLVGAPDGPEPPIEFQSPSRGTRISDDAGD